MEQIQLQLIIDTAQSAKSVGEAKKALRDIQGELLNIKDTGSKEFRELAAVAGDLKDRIGDAKDAIAAFTPEGKFAAIANAASGIASGFQAAQGAMALFGGESKEVEKVLLKVQAATAVAQGLQGVAGLGDAMGNMVNVIKSSAAQFLAWIGVVEGATVAQNILNVATRAFQALTSPLGLAITAVTAVVALATKAWYDEKTAIEENTKAAERNKKIKEDVLKSELAGWERIRELQNERKVGRDKELSEELLTYQKSVNGLKEKHLSEDLERRTREELLANHLFNVSEINKKFDDEAAEKAAEAKEKADEAKAKQEALELEAEEKRREDFKNRTKHLEAVETINILEKESDNAKTQNVIDNNQAVLENDEALLKQKLANRNAELQLATEVVNGLSQIGNIFIKDGEKNKKFQQRLALAQLAVDSGKALASAVAFSAANPSNAATFGIAGAIQYASTAAAILANIAKARQMIKGSDSGTPPTLGGASTPKTSVSLPNVPSLSNARNNGGGVSAPQQQQAQVYNQPIKVYVTETDITNSQKRVGTIEQRATIK